MTLTQDGFETREFRPGDETAILRLFAGAFHQPRALEHFRWKYESNPWGNRQISLTFSPEGELVAHYAAYPVPWHSSGHPGGPLLLRSLQVGDTMTAPGFRHIGRGPTSLLGRTVGHFYERYCDERVAFNYGFNTANIQKFSLRFVRARRVEPMPFQRGSLARLPRRGALSSWFSRYAVEPVSSVSSEWTDLFERVAPEYSALVRRDEDYLRWRFLDCPDLPKPALWALRHSGRLVGWSAFRRQGEDLMWGDALVESRHTGALATLLREASRVSFPEASLPRDILAWFTARPQWWQATLSDLGFRPEPEPQDLSLMCVPFLVPDADREVLSRAYYSRADGDLF